ncbi:MAG: knotted carbamoyltransferase YgeW [Candidatus Muiribacterium halophilum]|uniref:Knotted carbamoyltransferase YgeW n=1 Tax=Muiribacterium halophilum TaxID=2053465 RepID=A0A2N5Z9N1_MUIH1|nr:MAG: knotted carbamoyltransferase YgeW [Candidatus Muirbacterium halophilum]
MLKTAKQLLENISGLKTNMYNGDFLLTWDKTDDEIKATMYIAKILQELHKNNISTRVFDLGLAISNFRDNSTRTRFSFASAANLLGLEVQDLDEQKSQIAHGETVRETANMISFLSEVIGIRDDMYLGAGHTYQVEVAEAVEEGFREGVLAQRPSVINLQCDIDHPTQTMADLCHLDTYFGGIDNLKGKKIAMTWAYSPSYGKPLSVPQGIIGLMSRMGMNISLAMPEGYDLIPDTIDVAKNNSSKSGGSFEIVNSMEEAFKDADIVYPKSWAPFEVMKTRTELLRNQDSAGLKDLEQQCLANNAKLKNWECDEKKMSLTKDGKALYMHCLPADITGVSCKEGEVTKDVFEKYRIETYKEAGYKPFVIAAMMLLTRFPNTHEVLEMVARTANPRARHQ